MANKTFIIHFSPLEGYPPIINLLDYFSSKENSKKFTCFTTHSKLKSTYKNKKINIYRFGWASENKFILWFTYLILNFFTFFLLLIKRPKNVVYYETLSAFPAYLYKTYINKKVKLFIHYHEYATKQEYINSSIINRFFHQLEQKIYTKANWISHTNEVRLRKFLADNNLSYDNNIHYINPNYPSKNWGIKNKQWDKIEPIKLVFVGYAVDPKGCFILELIQWLSTQQHPTIIDIYCIKQNSLPVASIGKQGNTAVNVLNAITYQEIPKILKNYHVGLILYRGLTPNYIYNAPNKLFEYLACGLDVWFPKEMEGCYPYITDKNLPKVIKLDFNLLNNLKLEDLMDNSNLEYNKLSYFYENVYHLLFKELN